MVFSISRPFHSKEDYTVYDLLDILTIPGQRNVYNVYDIFDMMASRHHSLDKLAVLCDGMVTIASIRYTLQYCLQWDDRNGKINIASILYTL